jgi:deoxyribodipyrimidine photo-lyase
MKTCLFIFRRDLRIVDNICLNKLKGYHIIPVFIFNDYQIDHKKNKYYNSNAIDFMKNSICDLKKSLNGKLTVLYSLKEGDIDIISDIYKKNKFDCLAFNEDITPYAIKRDNIIKRWCKDKCINVITGNDYTLINPIGLKNNQRTPYRVFTPFKNKLLTMSIISPKTEELQFIKLMGVKEYVFEIKINNDFTRKKGLEIIKNITNGVFKKYDKERDLIFEGKTTRLGPYLKFGLVSCREVFTAFKKSGSSVLVSQLVWREFYYHLTYHYPDILKGQISGVNMAFKIKFNKKNWDGESSIYWKAFSSGKTGFPIIDAGISQLKRDGYVHNRVRMYIASFLTKNLLIDWRVGEVFFARYLYDYDPANNNGGWQWTASTGVDTQPYRVFNPWAQTKAWDPECLYIKKYIPELRTVDKKDILNWGNAYKKYKIDYPKPIVDYSKTIKEWKEWIKS